MKKAISTLLLLLVVSFGYSQKNKKGDKPNILVIWGDDIGWSNPSIYNMGMMGYKTPNIDKIGQDGMMFTDYYSQQSCTAGRSAFITGQSPYRTGLTKVGLPGAKEGLSGLDPTIAELLKNHGYATGQFGKNHLGDLDEHLPTNHGFDEFLGNLCLVMAIWQQVIAWDIQFRANFLNWAFVCLAGNLNVGFIGHQTCFPV